MENQDVLKSLRNILSNYIEKNYQSVEEYCWDAGMSKSTISNFLNSKKDFQLSTLKKIANSMGKDLKVTVK